jgi:hypothetical protein
MEAKDEWLDGSVWTWNLFVGVAASASLIMRSWSKRGDRVVLGAPNERPGNATPALGSSVGVVERDCQWQVGIAVGDESQVLLGREVVVERHAALLEIRGIGIARIDPLRPGDTWIADQDRARD